MSGHSNLRRAIASSRSPSGVSFRVYPSCTSYLWRSLEAVCLRISIVTTLSLSHELNTNTRSQVRGNKCSWFLSHEEDAASMWIDSIGRLQSVPMTQCRSTIRRWDMRPESVAVRLKTGRNPMVCCSGSEEELVIAAEIVALVRVLMSSSKEWASSFNVVLRQSLCSTFSLSTFRMFRGSLSVLGGYVEPIRKGCFVQVALGGGGDQEKTVRRCGRVAEIVSSVDKSSSNQVRVTLSEDAVSDSNESIWISQESVCFDLTLTLS